MNIQKKIAVFILGFLIAGFSIDFLFPKENVMNQNAEIRIGAGDDVSGIIMRETMQLLGEKYTLQKNVESTSFQDC